MSEKPTPEQEASKAIVSWAKQSYQPLSTAEDEMAAMERAGLLSGMRVDLISIELTYDMWKARLAIAGASILLSRSGWTMFISSKKTGCTLRMWRNHQGQTFPRHSP